MRRKRKGQTPLEETCSLKEKVVVTIPYGELNVSVDILNSVTTKEVDNEEEEVEVTSSTDIDVDVSSTTQSIVPITSAYNPEQASYCNAEWAPFDPYIFIKTLPPLSSVKDKNQRPFLPLMTRRTRKHTLVLDLDETLVHCSLTPLPDVEMTFPVFFQGVQYEVFVKVRPHFAEFLEKMANLFEVVVFTASKNVYANKLLDLLDPKKQFVRYRLFREHCLFVNGNYVKDLSLLGRDLAKTIIVDNSVQAFAYHLENGVPIESWFTNTDDQELLSLVPFLEFLSTVDDVRPHIMEQFKIHSLIPQD